MTILCLHCKALEVDLVVERGGRGIFDFRKTGVFVFGEYIFSAESKVGRP